MRVAAIKALRFVAERIGGAKDERAGTVMTSSNTDSSSSSSGKSAEVGLFDDMTDFSFSSSASSASATCTDPVLVEMEAFASLPEIEFRCAPYYKGKFDPAVFGRTLQ